MTYGNGFAEGDIEEESARCNYDTFFFNKNVSDFQLIHQNWTSCLFNVQTKVISLLYIFLILLNGIKKASNWSESEA